MSPYFFFLSFSQCYEIRDGRSQNKWRKCWTRYHTVLFYLRYELNAIPCLVPYLQCRFIRTENTKLKIKDKETIDFLKITMPTNYSPRAKFVSTGVNVQGYLVSIHDINWHCVKTHFPATTFKDVLCRIGNCFLYKVCQWRTYPFFLSKEYVNICVHARCSIISQRHSDILTTHAHVATYNGSVDSVPSIEPAPCEQKLKKT